jgi:aryl-alcohol dehydrogenase-like predicted oxidoreductase
VVRAGKIRYIGFSNTPAWVTAQALQVEYSLLARTVEGELAPRALDQGMALVPWSPLKNGFLSGRYCRDTAVGDSARTAFVGVPSEQESEPRPSRRGVGSRLGRSNTRPCPRRVKPAPIGLRGP